MRDCSAVLSQKDPQLVQISLGVRAFLAVSAGSFGSVQSFACSSPRLGPVLQSGFQDSRFIVTTFAVLSAMLTVKATMSSMIPVLEVTDFVYYLCAMYDSNVFG